MDILFSYVLKLRLNLGTINTQPRREVNQHQLTLSRISAPA
jgi:hypothetical protein